MEIEVGGDDSGQYQWEYGNASKNERTEELLFRHREQQQSEPMQVFTRSKLEEY